MKENEEIETTDFSDDEMEMVELSEGEENEVGGGSNAGNSKGYTEFIVQVGKASTMSACLKVAGQEVGFNQYRVINGWGIKWLWNDEYNGITVIRILCNPGPYAYENLGLEFKAKPLSGKGTKVKSFAGGWLRYNGQIVNLEWNKF